MALNFEFMHGRTYPIQFQAIDPSTGAAKDLTGWTLTFTMKRDLELDDDSAAVAKYTSTPANGVSIDNAAQGLYTVTIQAAATASLPNRPTTFYYDVKGVDGAGAVYSLSGPKPGVVTMNPSVTA